MAEDGDHFEALMENHAEGVLVGLQELLLEQRLVDMKLVAGTDRVQSIMVHKAVLLANSPYFKERLAEGGDANMIVFETQFSVLLALVEYMYYGKTQFGAEEGRTIVAAARLLRIDGLRAIRAYADLPEFPAPTITTELSCSSVSVPEVIGEEKGKSAANYDKKISSNYYARFPIVLDDNKNDGNGPKRRRGRPRRNSDISKLNDAIKSTIEKKVKHSHESFQVLKNIQVANKSMDEGLQMAIDSIRMPDEAAPPIDPYFNDNGADARMWSDLNLLESLGLADNSNNGMQPQQLQQQRIVVDGEPPFGGYCENGENASVPICYEYNEGSFVNVVNELPLPECKAVVDAVEFINLDEIDRFDGIFNIIDGNISDENNLM